MENNEDHSALIARILSDPQTLEERMLNFAATDIYGDLEMIVDSVCFMAYKADILHFWIRSAEWQK